MKFAVIIPSHNEAKYIGRVLKKTIPFCPTVIVVDDGSHDSTAKIARRYTPHVLSHATNLGKGAAMKTGADYAFETLSMHAIIYIDADDQHDPTQIPHFVKKLAKHDVVFGVRGVGASMPTVRYLGNKFASILLNILFGGYIEDIPSGYKAIRRRAYESIKWSSTGYAVETEIAVRVLQKKLPYATVGIEVIYHDHDKGMTILDAFRIAGNLFLWKTGIE